MVEPKMVAVKKIPQVILLIAVLILLILFLCGKANWRISPQEGIFFISRNVAAMKAASKKHYDPNITLYRLGLDEIREKAVKGNINEYLADYKNPCWFEGATSRAGIRCVPYFYELGVAKSGSTSLSHVLHFHPQIIAFWKELNYWNTREWREKSMDLSSYLRRIQNGSYYIYDHREKGTGYHNAVMFDATPQLLSKGQSEHPDNINSQQEPIYTLPHTLYMLNPKTRFVVTMRDPTDRLFSEYHHFSHGEEIKPEAFHEWSKRAINLMNKCLSQRTLRSCVFDQNLNKEINLNDEEHPQGLARFQFSMYYPFVKEYLSVFPRNQMYLIKAEEMYCDGRNVLTKVFKFLQLDDPTEDVLGNVQRVMDTKCSKSAKHDASGETYRSIIAPKTKTMLDAFFAPYNKQLAELLQDDKWLYK